MTHPYWANAPQVAPTINVPSLHPRNTTGTHCRRFYSAIAWDDAEMRAGNRSAIRRYTPQRRAEVA